MKQTNVTGSVADRSAGPDVSTRAKQPTYPLKGVGPLGALLALQRFAGNQTVSKLLEQSIATPQERTQQSRLQFAMQRSYPRAPTQLAVKPPGEPSEVASPMESGASERVAELVAEQVARKGPPVGSEDATRAFVGSRLGHDLSNVRIHTDSRAARLTASVDALAFTLGRDIFFANGAYRPQTAAGRRLLAHEFTHAAEQRIGVPRVQRQSAAEERKRVAGLNAEYRTAFEGRNWARAAELLNGYDDDEIRTRAHAMNHEQRIQMYAGARRSMPNFHGRVTGTIAEIDPEARRVGQLTFDYLDAIERRDWPRAAEVLNVFNDIDIRTKVAERPAEELPALRAGAGERFSRITYAIDALVASRRLAEALERIRRIKRNTTLEAAVREIEAAVSGIDLGLRSNLAAVIRAVSDTFGGDSGAILATFLTHVEQAMPSRQPSPKEAARMDKTIGLLQVPRRGPYGQRGPGVVLPAVSNVARPLVPAVEAISHGFEGAGAFISGVIEGLAGSLNDEQRAELANRMLQSPLLNAVFPPVFLSGTAVGIVEDIVDAIKGIYHLITNLGEFVNGVVTVTRAILSPESAVIGHAIGLEVGRSYGARIAAMAGENLFRFTFDLGRMIGPTIVYIILAFVGAPAVVASSIVQRLLPVLQPLLQRFPRLLRLVEGMAGSLREKSARTVLGRTLEARRLTTTLEPILAKIRKAVRSGAISTHTFDEALTLNLATEGAGLAEVIAALPKNSKFRSLYRIAYDGMNNRDIWEAVLGDIAREAEKIAPGRFSHPEIRSRYTQAVWNLSEQASGPGGKVIATPPDKTPGYEFIKAGTPWGPRFYDVNIGRGHGMSSHMVHDLVVDRAFQRAGVEMTAEQFRAQMGTMKGSVPGLAADQRTLLWNALYDSHEGRLVSPDTAIALLRETLAPDVD